MTMFLAIKMALAVVRGEEFNVVSKVLDGIELVVEAVKQCFRDLRWFSLSYWLGQCTRKIARVHGRLMFLLYIFRTLRVYLRNVV